MRFGKQATPRGRQTPAETEKWARLVNLFTKNGGVGAQLDFHATVVGVKHPHEVTFMRDGVRIISNWGNETPMEARTKISDDGREYPMPEGCLLTYELVGDRYGGLRVYKESTWSGDDRTILYKTGNALFPGQLEALDLDPERDYVGRDLILTLRMEAAHERLSEEGDPLKGGHWWGITAFKAIPVGDDDDDAPPPIPTRRPATTQRGGAAVADRDTVPPDDDYGDVPF